ncbi:hypothetical protein [Neisseria sp. Ec49-e6-T10]|uniref:hypothetical protein n=1 Tax=Neisseria sp. Ec49-e6-T10 TaxID=3140744 RepID=UPI003EBDD2CB
MNAKDSLAEILTLDGALCCSVVDYNSGMMLASAGSGADLEIASAGNTEVVRAKLKTMELLGKKDHIEDILISLGTEYHIIYLIPSLPGIFIYAVLDHAKGNLAMARRKIQDVGSSLTI